MRINCAHGYFTFEEQRVGELSQFVSIFGLELVREGDYFTFSDLVDAPEYSLAGGTYLDAPTIANCSGKPWEIFRANSLIYNYDLGLVQPIASIVQFVTVQQAGKLFVSEGLIMPGSMIKPGVKITDYVAYWSQDSMRFRYSEVISD